MRGGPYAAIALAVVSVSFSAIFISWSTSPFITIALYRLALASLILAPFAFLDRRRPLRGVLLLYTLGLRESLLPVGDWRTEFALFLAMAVIPQIGGHTLYNWSLRWVTVPVVSLSLVGEPIGSSVLAWALLGQMPGAAVGIGGALALGGIYLTAMGQGARSKETLGARDTG